MKIIPCLVDRAYLFSVVNLSYRVSDYVSDKLLASCPLFIGHFSIRKDLTDKVFMDMKFLLLVF